MAQSCRKRLRAHSPRRTVLLNLGLMLGATIFAVLLAEPLLRLRYPEPVTPRMVLEVQPYLRAHPVLGFTWERDIPSQRGILFHYGDIEFESLSTDEFGVINAPDAIARRRAGEPVDVLGLGDSFMEMAAPAFYRRFAACHVSYYSLAIHRHAPPHHAVLFANPGIAMKPMVAVLGLFENDFAETEDYLTWRTSGLPWFDYHSGTWYGPPVPITVAQRFVHTWFRGYEALTMRLRVRLRGERVSVTGVTDAQVAHVSKYLGDIAAGARDNHIALWIVLVPGKATALGEVTPEARAYDLVIQAIGDHVAGVVDLRPVFQAHPDPMSLYYRRDGHWNGAGIALAGEIVLRRLGICGPHWTRHRGERQLARGGESAGSSPAPTVGTQPLE